MITKLDIHELFPNSQTINRHRDITTYHGSEKWFQDFDFKKVGGNTGNDYLSLLGFHFTEDYDIAKGFSKQLFSNNKDSGQILTVNLHMNKTLKLTEHELVLGIYKYGDMKGLTFINYDYVKDLPYFLPYPQSIDKETGIDKETLYDTITKEIDEQTTKKIVRSFKQNILLKNGYDSIEYLNQIECRKNKNRYDFIILKQELIEVDLQRIQRF